MKLVKCPAIDLDTMLARIAESDGMKICSDILIDFYKDLGWSPETHEIEPVNIKMNPVDQSLFCDNMLKLASPDISATEINIMLLMKGPSSEERVPKGKVWLKDGWLIAIPESSQTA